MAKSSAKRVARRLTAKRKVLIKDETYLQPDNTIEFSKQFPEPNFGKLTKAKIVQVVAVPQGNAGTAVFGLGKDSKMYVWNSYLGGWVENVMNADEKARMKIAIAVQAKLDAEGKGAATNEAPRTYAPEQLAEMDRKAKENGAKHNPAGEDAKRQAIAGAAHAPKAIASTSPEDVFN